MLRGLVLLLVISFVCLAIFVFVGCERRLNKKYA
jgi:hypothetical protein